MTRIVLGDSSSRTTSSGTGSAADPPRLSLRETRLFEIGWRLMLTLLLIALLLLFSALAYPDTASAQSASDPLVLAFFYAWFDHNTWSQGLTSDQPLEPYASADRAVMGRQIDQAKAAGIDAFVVAWYGNGGGNPTESNLAALLEEAAARDFRIAILFESNSSFMAGIGDAASAMQHAMQVHVNQPAYLRVDGHPVFFFWQTQQYGVGDWQWVRDLADPARNAIWIADGVDTSYLSLFDGHHLYSNTWSPAADLTAVNQKFAGLVQSARQATGAPKLWVATVMPGYDDILVRGGFAQDREGGGYYGRSWAAAIASQPNWVIITSFNEWLEGSQIEPSVKWGDAFLGLTATYSAQFKSGGGITTVFPELKGVATSDTAFVAAAASAPLLPEVAPDEPTAYVQAALLNIREGPGGDFAILAMAKAGDALPVMGKATLDADGSEWWQVIFEGVPGWVSGEYVTALGPLDGVPVIPTTAEQAQALDTAVEASATPVAFADAVEVTAANDVEEGVDAEESYPEGIYVVALAPFPLILPLAIAEEMLSKAAQ